MFLLTEKNVFYYVAKNVCLKTILKSGLICSLPSNQDNFLCIQIQNYCEVVVGGTLPGTLPSATYPVVYVIRTIILLILIRLEIDQDFSQNINLTCGALSRRQVSGYQRFYTFHHFSHLLIYACTPTTEKWDKEAQIGLKKKKKKVYLLIFGLLIQEMSFVIIIIASNVPCVFYSEFL